MNKRFQFILSGIILFMILTGALLFTTIVQRYVYKELVNQAITDNKVIAQSILKLIEQQIASNAQYEDILVSLRNTCNLLSLPNDGYVCAIDANGTLVAYPNFDNSKTYDVANNQFTLLDGEQSLGFKDFFGKGIFEGYYGNQKNQKFDIMVALLHKQTGLKVMVHQNNLLINQAANKHFEKLLFMGALVALIISTITFFITNKQVKIFNKKIHIKNQALNEALESVAEHNLNLQEKTLLLEDLNNQKDGIIEIVAHDLKSPIHRAKGLVTLTRLTGRFTKEQTEHMDLLSSELDNQEKLINDILEANKLESQLESVNKEKIDLIPFIEELSKVYKDKARSKAQTFTLQSDADSVLLHTDPILLERILDNLVSNAIKYSEKDKEIKVEIVSKTNDVSISVIDQGQGFNKEDRNKMFRKFQKLSAQPTNNESSNGLGLYIVKQLTDRLDGDIKVKSSNAMGTEFILTFDK